jgi:hypothetical protein
VRRKRPAERLEVGEAFTLSVVPKVREALDQISRITGMMSGRRLVFFWM